MSSSRLIRTSAVLALAGLVIGLLAAVPAEAKKKKKKPAVCAAYVPGDAGADKPTVTVTDAATEEAPLEQAVTIDASAGDADLAGTGALAPGTDAFNVQVDSAAKEAGLYVLFEFPARQDYDLNLLWPDGSYAARSHDFNTLYSPDPRTYSNGGVGGESSDTYEKIVGVRTPDCGGYTVGLESWLAQGGDFTVKLWLGEIKNDPEAPGAETP